MSQAPVVRLVLAFVILFSPTLCLAENIKIVSLNLYNRPIKRAARLTSAAVVLRDLAPDIVALQEVATGLILPQDPYDLISSTLGMTGARDWHQTNFGFFKTGLATLTKFPIEHSEYVRFKNYPFWRPKGFQYLKIKISERSIGLINLQLASQRTPEIRNDEMKELDDFVAKHRKRDEDLLIVGDFSMETGEPALSSFVEKWKTEDLFDLVSPIPDNTWTPDLEAPCTSVLGKKMDHILLLSGTPKRISFNGGMVVRGTTLPRASDHCPVLGDLLIQ